MKLILSITKRYKSEERFKMKSKLKKTVNSKIRNSLPTAKQLYEMRQNLRKISPRSLRHINKIAEKKQSLLRKAASK